MFTGNVSFHRYKYNNTQSITKKTTICHKLLPWHQETLARGRSNVYPGKGRFSALNPIPPFWVTSEKMSQIIEQNQIFLINMQSIPTVKLKYCLNICQGKNPKLRDFLVFSHITDEGLFYVRVRLWVTHRVRRKFAPAHWVRVPPQKLELGEKLRWKYEETRHFEFFPWSKYIYS